MVYIQAWENEPLNNGKDRCMKLCINCGQPIQEDSNKKPAEILGDLVEQSINAGDDSCLCQACKEELGMLSLMGFGEWSSFSGEYLMAVMIPDDIQDFCAEGKR